MNYADFNFETRKKSNRFKPSHSPIKVTHCVTSDGSHTIAIPNSQIAIKFKNEDNKKIIIGKTPANKISYCYIKKIRNDNILNNSDMGFTQTTQFHETTNEEKSSRVVNMRLEIDNVIKTKSSSRNRSMVSRQKVNYRQLSVAFPGSQKKSLMDKIKNHPDNFFVKDSYKFISLLESKKKANQQQLNSINKKLLHIEKMKPARKVKDRSFDQKQSPIMTQTTKLLPYITPPRRQPESLQQQQQQQQIQRNTQNINILMKQKHEMRNTFNQYALCKKGFAGKKDYFVFGLSDKPQDYITKIQMYRDFLWKVNFTNNLFIEPQSELQKCYKVFIGKGNNSMLVRGLMKRRFWWTIVDTPQEANFSWSQLKNPDLIKKQLVSTVVLNNNLANSFSSQSFNCDGIATEETESKPLRSKSAKKRYKSTNGDSDTQKSISGVQKQTSTKPIKKRSKIIKPLIPPYIKPKDSHQKLFNQDEMILWKKHMQKYPKYQSSFDDKTYLKRSWLLKIKQAEIVHSCQSLLITNHFITNTFIGNKKALFYAMRKFYQLKKQNVFTVLPVTFHISSRGVDDPEYKKFLQVYNKFDEQKQKDRNIRNIWIAKPGQFTNRGTGITVCASLDDVKLRLRGRQKNANGTYRTFILQKYIQKPLLYNKRKFDIRHYMLITCINGRFKGYWYQQGYLRTSSYEFSTKNYRDPQIHLTNDAIQKHNESYGKYEKGNKLSYADFQKYLDSGYKNKNYDFFNNMLPRMKQIAANSIRSSYFLLDSDKRLNNFEIFGLDFMIDEEFNPWLIEVNTNPCLQLGCPLLSRLIPSMVQNALKIGLDPLFPPPYVWQAGRKYQLGDDPLNNNRFQLIFDEVTQGTNIQQLYKNIDKIDKNMGQIEEQDEQFQQQTGKQWDGQL